MADNEASGNFTGPVFQIGNTHGSIHAGRAESAGSGRGLLLLPAGARDLADSRVDVVAHVKPLLLRPDGVIAWAGGDAASLAVALDMRFGPVC